MNGNFFLIFLLMLALILVAYYTGASADFASLSSAAQQLIFALTGRNKAGAFAAYP